MCFVERQRDCQCASVWAEQLLALRAGCWAGCKVRQWQFAPLEHSTANEHSPSGHRNTQTLIKMDWKQPLLTELMKKLYFVHGK